jgi:hypothetical protein
MKDLLTEIRDILRKWQLSSDRLGRLEKALRRRSKRKSLPDRVDPMALREAGGAENEPREARLKRLRMRSMRRGTRKWTCC